MSQSPNSERLPDRALRILFVCVENANRSQMAEAFARRLGGGRVDASSAGSRPSGRVNPRAIEFMREVGCDLALHTSKSLADLPSIEFDAVVTMGCGDNCPQVRARERFEWNIPDPRDLPPDRFREVRDLIGRNVQSLLEALLAGARPVVAPAGEDPEKPAHAEPA